MNFVIRRLIIFLLALFYLNFFEFNFLSEQANNFKLLSLFFIVIICFIFKSNSYKLPFKKYIYMYIFGIFLSSFFCFLYWKQPIIISLKALKSFYILTLYFALHRLKPSLNDLKIVILLLGLLYCLAYIINIIFTS